MLRPCVADFVSAMPAASVLQAALRMSALQIFALTDPVRLTSFLRTTATAAEMSFSTHPRDVASSCRDSAHPEFPSGAST
jgi:hypothetical protein